MQIEDFKTWHWVAIGLIAGLAFSCALVMAGPPFATEELDTVDASTFEHALLGRLVRGREDVLAAKFHKGLPLLKNVVVHPPLRGLDPHQFWVTGQIYDVGPQLKNPSDPRAGEQYIERWMSFKYPAPAPYVGQNGAGIAGKYANVADYVAAADRAKLTTVTCRQAWQEAPSAVWTLPPVAGLLIIGVAWPLALGAMQRVGMARAPKVKAAPKPAAPPPPVAKPAPAVRDVVIVPPPAPKPVAVADHKEYGGEFYPVVKPAHHE